MTMRTDEALELERRYLSPSVRLAFEPLLFERASGAHLWDGEGRRFLDFHAMACICNTGHNHPNVVAAIKRQADRLLHTNTAYGLTEPLVELARELARRVPGGFDRRVAFGLSGSDANDGAIKLARAATGRQRVIAFHGAYHGNTYGALSLSAVSLAMRRGFGPEVPGVHHIPYPDVYRMEGSDDEVAERCLEAFRRLLSTTAPAEEVAAVFIEPVQGDSGILIPPARYLDGLTQICREHGILIVAEEVQTGFGRTGRWFASEHFGLEPDVIVLGKAMGSGMPVSAVVARSELMDSWSAPGHVFSTGANPVCCEAARATIETIESEGLVERSSDLGERLRSGARELADRYEAIGDVRGLGLMNGIDLVRSRETKERATDLAPRVIVGCLKRGLFLTFLSGSVLRLVPPLVVSADDVDRALIILDESLDDALAGRVSDDEIRHVVGW